MKPAPAGVFIDGADIDVKVWDKFFCVTCQTERHLSLRVRFGKHNMPRCTLCLAKKHQPYKAKAGRPTSARGYTADDLAVPLETYVPDEIVEAYQESLN